jgi:hypothetical protein
VVLPGSPSAIAQGYTRAPDGVTAFRRVPALR